MKSIRSKLLLSYLIVLLVGVAVTLLSVSFTSRLAYDRQMMHEGMRMGQGMNPPQPERILMQFCTFRISVF